MLAILTTFECLLTKVLSHTLQDTSHNLLTAGTQGLFICCCCCKYLHTARLFVEAKALKSQLLTVYNQYTGSICIWLDFFAWIRCQSGFVSRVQAAAILETGPFYCCWSDSFLSTIKFDIIAVSSRWCCNTFSLAHGALPLQSLGLDPEFASRLLFSAPGCINSGMPSNIYNWNTKGGYSVCLHHSLSHFLIECTESQRQVVC